MRVSNVQICLLVPILLIGALFAAPSAKADKPTLAFVASSLTDVLEAVAKRYSDENSDAEIKLSFAGSGQLARQIDAGAPADILITAHREWLDWALLRDLLQEDSVREVAGNRLVVAVRREVENWANVEAMLTTGRFAMADPDSVPAGLYGRNALKALGWWEQARHHAAFSESARITLLRLVRGEVQAAIVFESDLRQFSELRSVRVFREEETGPIRYHAALTKNARDAAAPFLEFLASKKALAIFSEQGFTLPD